ncbi:MAG: hypothetical protein IT348_10290 [Candidatus Eisenbacteria bacterium]|nr:hypothetical protein [Candidatus Eisenbacteria bacterium]
MNRKRIRILVEVGILAVCGALLWVAGGLRAEPPGSHDELALWPVLALLLFVVPLAFVIQAVRRKPAWQPLPPLAPKPLAVLDTLLVCCTCLYTLATMHEGQGVVLVVCGVGAMLIMLPHARGGLHVSVSELLAFYTGISLLDVVTGKAPHERLHPTHAHDGEWEAQLYSVRGFGDLVLRPRSNDR